MSAHICPTCGEPFRLVWIGNDPPEPYGEVCGCPDPKFVEARDEKLADDADRRDFHIHNDLAFEVMNRRLP